MPRARRALRAPLALLLALSSACTRPSSAPDADAPASTERRAAPVAHTATQSAGTSLGREPLPHRVGALTLEASCGTTARPCHPGQDVGVRVASTDVDGVLYVFVVEDPGRSLLAGPLAVKAGAPLLLPVSMMAEEHDTGVHLEGAVFTRPLDAEELDRIRGGEALVGAVSRIEVLVRAK